MNRQRMLWRGMVVMGLLGSAAAQAQPNPLPRFEQEARQCLQAKTLQQCRDAQPACQRTHNVLAVLPSEPKLQLFHARLLNDWAWCENQLGQYAQAEGHYRSALALRRNLLGAEHLDVAASLNNLASVLDNQGKYDEAERLYQQVLTLRQKQLGDEHPDVASSLNNLAFVLDRQGKYGEAERLFQQALVLSQKVLGEEHPIVASSLNNLAAVLDRQGKYGEAERLFRQALALRQKLLGGEHPDVASSLNNLASVLDHQGKYGEAERLYRLALALSQKLLGGEHPDVASGLNNLAFLLNHQGKYGEAERLYRQALALRQRLLGEEHPAVASSLNNLAWALDRQGKHGEAERLYQQALTLWQKRLGEEHPYVATGLNNLALALDRQGRYGEAERLYRQALALRQKVLGDEHPDVASTLNNLAAELSRQGKYGEAERLCLQALTLRKKLLGEAHPDVALSLNNLASMLDSQGRHGEAEPFFLQALALRQKLLPEEHPDVAMSLNNLSALQLAMGRTTSALSFMRKAAQIRELQLRATVSETRMQALLDDIRGEEDAIYGLLLQPKVEGIAELALGTALLRKGRVAEAGAAANRVVQGQRSTPEVAKRFAQWQAVRQQREALLYGGSGALKPADYRQRLAELKQQAESLEHRLVADLPELKTVQPPAMDQIVSQVAGRLPQDGVLVEVVWAEPYQAGAGASGKRWGEPHYIALLLFPDRRIEVVDMGAAAMIDPQARGLLAALSSPQGDAVKAGQAVYARVMKRLVDALAGRRNIYLSLDGTLSVIPFDALHDGTDYLLGRYRFHYLSSGRDLLREAAQRTAGASLVLGNPDFGKAEQKSAAAGPADLYQRLSELQALPGTQREVAAIGALLGVEAQTGRAAREEAVRAVHAPRILHIATHGLFLQNVELPTSISVERGMDSLSRLDRPRSKIIAVPMAERLPGELGAMNRSALVLADAVQGASAQDTARDGLLTADEARSLDLYGTQLVALSACETGQGALSAGQGIYGLRRAFMVAGAETLVTSLWRVSDEATGELMTRYYEKLLDAKKPGDRLGAMVEAMAELRKKPGRAHPYYWAPFLVIGSDGPLH